MTAAPGIGFAVTGIMTDALGIVLVALGIGFAVTGITLVALGITSVAVGRV